MCDTWKISGVDLAWGQRMPDAIVTGRLEHAADRWQLSDLEVIYEKLEVAALCDLLLKGDCPRHLVAIDAPLVCRNKAGSRPVDKDCSALYRQQEAGCHPVNLTLVQRPLLLAEELRHRSVTISKEWQPRGVRAIEVYPHPTMINWFGLTKTIKYKKGNVADKRCAFKDYQKHLSQWLAEQNITIQENTDIHSALTTPWTKRTEDILDAFLCLLIGCWDVMHNGNKSQKLGDDETGFIVIGEQ